MKPSLEKAAFWEFVLAEHARSGLGISEFCHREGVSQASFYYWRKKLAGSTLTPPGRFPGTSGESSRFASFLPVQVVSSNDSHVPDQQRLAQCGNSWPVGHVTIRTPGGYVVDVSPSTSADLLGRILLMLDQVQSGSRFCNEPSAS